MVTLSIKIRRGVLRLCLGWLPSANQHSIDGHNAATHPAPRMPLESVSQRILLGLVGRKPQLEDGVDDIDD